MTVLERIRERARERRARIVLPEGNDPRVIEAAETLRRERLCEPVLVDDDLVEARREEYGELLWQRRKHKGMTLDQALYEMELVGHDFYLFVDKDNERPSVVYRRRGYDYGVISLDVVS